MSGLTFKRHCLPKYQRVDLMVDAFRVKWIVCQNVPFSSSRSAPILPHFYRAEPASHVCPIYVCVCLCTVGEGRNGAPRRQGNLFGCVTASRPFVRTRIKDSHSRHWPSGGRAVRERKSSGIFFFAGSACKKQLTAGRPLESLCFPL